MRVKVPKALSLRIYMYHFQIRMARVVVFRINQARVLHRVLVGVKIMGDGVGRRREKGKTMEVWMNI